jgi:ribonuclease P protein component
MRTLTAHTDIDRLFAGGRRVSHPALLVLGARSPEGPDAPGRVMFVAGKRLGGAVWRNRSKRVMREAMRRAGGPCAGWDVALIARTRTASASTAELDEALRAAMAALEIRR